VHWAGIEPAGHWGYLDQLEQVASAVRDFAQPLR